MFEVDEEEEDYFDNIGRCKGHCGERRERCVTLEGCSESECYVTGGIRHVGRIDDLHVRPTIHSDVRLSSRSVHGITARVH